MSDPRALEEVMDEMSREAKERGLTPEKLDEILTGSKPRTPLEFLEHLLGAGDWYHSAIELEDHADGMALEREAREIIQRERLTADDRRLLSAAAVSPSNETDELLSLIERLTGEAIVPADGSER